jgi:hypothetical protein
VHFLIHNLRKWGFVFGLVPSVSLFWELLNSAFFALASFSDGLNRHFFWNCGDGEGATGVA